MSRVLLMGAGTLALALAGLGWRIVRPPAADTVFEAKVKPAEAAPLCPWREPEADLTAFFPDATRYEKDRRILSGLRPELTTQLGRAPTGDENTLHFYRVYRETTPLGTILTRRVKGECGAIEIVLAVGADHRVRGLRLQRLREPQEVADALQNGAWLRAFEAKEAKSAWQLGRDLPEVPSSACPSAEAVIDGVRSLLILLAAADHVHPTSAGSEPHH